MQTVELSASKVFPLNHQSSSTATPLSLAKHVAWPGDRCLASPESSMGALSPI